MVAFLVIVVALTGMVTNAGTRPHVMHGPYYRLTGQEYFPEILQGEHALVDPMQVDDIRLFELR